MDNLRATRIYSTGAVSKAFAEINTHKTLKLKPQTLNTHTHTNIYIYIYIYISIYQHAHKLLGPIARAAEI